MNLSAEILPQPLPDCAVAAVTFCLTGTAPLPKVLTLAEVTHANDHRDR